MRSLASPADKYPVSFERVHRRKDGTTFPVEVRSTAVDEGGAVLVLALVRDITRRKQDEEALRNEQQLLRVTLNLLERDRQLVAYEIHDGLAQQLAGASTCSNPSNRSAPAIRRPPTRCSTRANGCCGKRWRSAGG